MGDRRKQLPIAYILADPRKAVKHMEKLNPNSNSFIKAKRIKANSNSYKRQSKAQNISTEQKATMLIVTLRADMSYLRWYCKVVNTLPENIIQNILEGARNAGSPDRYFASAAKIEMDKLC